MAKRVAIYLVAILIILSCDRYEGFGPIYLEQGDSISVSHTRSKLIIGCEGNFQLGNASLSALDLETGELQNNVYNSTNGESIGDVLQSMYHRGDTLFVVVNNSGLIRLLNDSTFEQIAVIEGLTSPRYLICNGRQLYVTDLYADMLNVYDLGTLKKVQEVDIGGWSERMLYRNDNFLVANLDNNRIEVLSRDLARLRTIDLNFRPRYLEEYDMGVVIAGNDDPFQATSGTVQLYDDNYELTNTLEFGSQIQALAVSAQDLFVIVKGELLQYGLPDLALINKKELEVQTPYSMILNEAEQILYITDVRDFISKGRLIEYQLNDHTISNEFEVGQIPQALLFTLD